MSDLNKNEDLKKKPITVMIIDDSSIIRLLLRDVLNQDSAIEVISHAINGKLALPRIRYYQPQIVILDYEMPELNGIETLKLIKKINRQIMIKIDYSPLYIRCQPSVNMMFQSLVNIMPHKTVAVNMTGMGSDGYEAMKELKKADAYLMWQSKESCLVYGMPAKPSEGGLVSESLDIRQLAERITFLLGA